MWCRLSSKFPPPLLLQVMIIPVRCFTCGKCIADKYHEYVSLLTETEMDEGEAMTALGLHRWCCRRMFQCHVDFSDQLLKFNPADNADIAHIGAAAASE